MPTRPSKRLETFPNPRPGREYEIAFECAEFTCVCPKTGQPDFATIRIYYTPDQICVELKSLKLYLWSFREEGHFHEDVTNRILDDLVEVLTPVRMKVVGDFGVRGGIHAVVTAVHEPGRRQVSGFADAKGADAKGRRGKETTVAPAPAKKRRRKAVAASEGPRTITPSS